MAATLWPQEDGGGGVPELYIAPPQKSAIPETAGSLPKILPSFFFLHDTSVLVSGFKAAFSGSF
jgi:hypothetical protein